MAAGSEKGGEQAAADQCGLLVSARQPRFGHPGAKPAQWQQAAVEPSPCASDRQLLAALLRRTCVPLHACRPAPQALQTLMARQRVAYDFEYFRCVCVFSCCLPLAG